MAPPAFRAKVVTTVVVGALGVGVFAGVSNDGRGAEPAVVDHIDDPSTTTTVSSSNTPSSFTVTTITPAEPAVPDPTPTRARVRSGGS
jgi:hypothetical protein